MYARALPMTREPKKNNRQLGAQPAETTVRAHICLVGFMGCGKSTIGRLLAERLQRNFIDLDHVIAETAGKSIQEIFRTESEVGFRARERAVLRHVLQSNQSAVIATGGGTFIDKTMRELIQAHARSIFLHTREEVLVVRLTETTERSKRPLLSGPDPVANIKRLLQERAPIYEQSDFTVTAHAAVDDTVEAIVRLLQNNKKRAIDLKISSLTTLDVVAQSHTYKVEFRAHVGAWIAEAIAEVCPGKRLAIISDAHVWPIHGQTFQDVLSTMNKEISVHVLEAGEQSKSLHSAGRLYDALANQELDRKDSLIALGGGVIGDLTGFVASTYLRGIAYVQVPTTTLAAVDSSVGGKTAVNIPQGKNLVGTFYPPRGVYVAIQHLMSQSKRAHAAGLIEALKMAATLDGTLFASLVQDATSLLAFDEVKLSRALLAAVKLKATVVANDEREVGLRAVLNYGHTVGHAIETGEEYMLPHGETVALGMIAEAEWAEAVGYADGVSSELRRAIQTFGVAVDWRRYRLAESALMLDKKRHGTSIHMPVVKTLGSFDMKTVALESIRDYLKEYRNS